MLERLIGPWPLEAKLATQFETSCVTMGKCLFSDKKLLDCDFRQHQMTVLSRLMKASKWHSGGIKLDTVSLLFWLLAL